jgi:hypothetical protein
VNDLDPVQVRVLGCLLEKQQTTPDAYPLTLNALRLACNQSTNRDPVTGYDDATVRDAAQRLGQRRLARLASGAGSRAPKYRHLLDEELRLGPDEKAVICVLALRGPQTPGELKQRAERMHAFADLEAVEAALSRLAERGLVAQQGRQPGQKEARWSQLLGGEAAGGSEAPEGVGSPAPAERSEVERLSVELAALRRDLDALRADLAGLRRELGGGG